MKEWKNMITLTGKSVFGGVEIGKIAFYKRNERQVKRWHVEDTKEEIKRFEDAKLTLFLTIFAECRTAD